MLPPGSSPAFQLFSKYPKRCKAAVSSQHAGDFRNIPAQFFVMTVSLHIVSRFIELIRTVRRTAVKQEEAIDVMTLTLASLAFEKMRRPYPISSSKTPFLRN